MTNNVVDSDMATIYTGCFFLKYHNALKVSIARSAPKCFKGRSLEALAPSMGLLRDYKAGKVSVEEYAERYRGETLAQLDRDEVARYIHDICDYFGPADSVVLCCWERPGKFCHRQLVGEWLGIEEAAPL